MISLCAVGHDDILVGAMGHHSFLVDAVGYRDIFMGVVDHHDILMDTLDHHPRSTVPTVGTDCFLFSGNGSYRSRLFSVGSVEFRQFPYDRIPVQLPPEKFR